jgi:hypothetical protein
VLGPTASIVRKKSYTRDEGIFDRDFEILTAIDRALTVISDRASDRESRSDPK